jgi:ribosomal protein S6--L-glutamate ligase
VNVGVFCNPNSWYLRDLQRAAQRDFRVDQLPFTRLQARVGESGGEIWCDGKSLVDFDVIITRTMPPGSLEQVVFRMDALAELASRGVVMINSPRAVEMSVDKYLATARIRAAGLSVPETIVCQDWETALDAYHRLGGDVVVKPLFGGEGRGITRVDDEAIAERVFKTLTQLQAAVYLQPFVDHDGEDWRILRVGEQLHGIRRRNELDWRTNVSRGAKAARLEVTSELADLAFAASDAVGAEFAGVDILPAQDGRLLVLEVNASPGWKALVAALDVDIARDLLLWSAEKRQVAAADPRGG